MSRSRWVVGLLLVCVALGSVRADDEGDGKAARTLYNRGMAHFRLAEYDQAIELWQDGFRRKPVPELLYNIAQAHRLAKRPEQALAYYQQYLSMSPKASNRPEVERHITELTALVEEQKKAAAAAAAAKPEEPPASAPVAPAPTAASDNQIVAAPPAKKPLYKKAWFWGAIAGGAVVIGGAVALGVVLGTRSSHRTVDPVVFP